MLKFRKIQYEIWTMAKLIVDRNGPVCTENLNPDVMAMESAKDGEGFDASGPLNRANGWRVFVQ